MFNKNPKSSPLLNKFQDSSWTPVCLKTPSRLNHGQPPQCNLYHHHLLVRHFPELSESSLSCPMTGHDQAAESPEEDMTSYDVARRLETQKCSTPALFKIVLQYRLCHARLTGVNAVDAMQRNELCSGPESGNPSNQVQPESGNLHLSGGGKISKRRRGPDI